MIHSGTLQAHERTRTSHLLEQAARHRLPGCQAMAKLSTKEMLLYFCADERTLTALMRALPSVREGERTFGDNVISAVRLPEDGTLLVCVCTKSTMQELRDLIDFAR